MMKGNMIMHVFLAFVCLHMLYLSKSSLQPSLFNSVPRAISRKELDDITPIPSPQTEEEWIL